MSPGNLIEVFSSVFVAFTFALLEFCTPGTFSFAMQSVLHIYIILHLHLFSAALFSAVCSVGL